MYALPVIRSHPNVSIIVWWHINIFTKDISQLKEEDLLNFYPQLPSTLDSVCFCTLSLTKTIMKKSNETSAALPRKSKRLNLKRSPTSATARNTLKEEDLNDY